jgi:hypothetical protein
VGKKVRTGFLKRCSQLVHASAQLCRNSSLDTALSAASTLTDGTQLIDEHNAWRLQAGKRTVEWRGGQVVSMVVVAMYRWQWEQEELVREREGRDSVQSVQRSAGSVYVWNVCREYKHTPAHQHLNPPTHQQLFHISANHFDRIVEQATQSSF